MKETPTEETYRLYQEMGHMICEREEMFSTGKAKPRPSRGVD